MFNRLEREAMQIFVSDLRHARKVKATLIRLAKEEPERITRGVEGLDEKDQKYLSWLRRIAEENLR